LPPKAIMPRKPGSPLLEICCFNVESVLIAQDSGADRIELCENYSQGGISPNLKTLENLIPKIHIPIYCMVRPRGGDFNYSEREFITMQEEIEERKKLGIQGFVFGILDKNRNLETERLKILVKEASPLPITFHRAFDEVLEPEKALETIIDLGFERILTSGQKPKAWEGRDLIKRLVNLAGNRISIMPGSGIRSDNIEELFQETQAHEFHGSALFNPESEIADGREIQNLRNKLNLVF